MLKWSNYFVCDSNFNAFLFISVLTSCFYVTRPHMEIWFPALPTSCWSFPSSRLVCSLSHWIHIPIFSSNHVCIHTYMLIHIFLLIFLTITAGTFFLCIILNTCYLWYMAGNITTISKDRVKLSPQPSRWMSLLESIWLLLRQYDSRVLLGSI